MRGWRRLGSVLSVFWFVALAIFLPLPARTEELYSFSVMVMPRVVVTPENANVPSPVCDGQDHWIDIKTGLTGAGVFPEEPVVIVGTQLWSFFSNPRSYVMIGQTPPNGDAITPYVFGTSTMPPVFFPSGHGFAFDPTRDELHLHYLCYSYPEDKLPQFGFTLFYVKSSVATVPSAAR
jgi:hypothetical protein